MKRELILITLLSFSLLALTLLTLPHGYNAQPSPYLHVEITPFAYWAGLCATICGILAIVIPKGQKKSFYSVGFLFVLLLTVYVYDVPKLFYPNPIYNDTYIFIGETLFTLSYGHIGYGHSLVTPGLALFSSQLCMITGANQLAIAEAILFIIPLAFMFAFYLTAKMFVGKRVALLACLFFMAIDWMSFQYNRQSFSFMLQIFMLYALFRIFMDESASLPMYTVVVVSYVVLTMSHPVSSLLVIIVSLVTAVLSYLMSNRRAQHIFRVREGVLKLRRQARKAAFVAVIFSIIWFSWSAYSGENLNIVIGTLDETVQGLFASAHGGQLGGLAISYTSAYLPVVRLRIAEVAFEAAVGAVLALLALIGISLLYSRVITRTGLILSSWFFGSMSISVFGLFGNWLQLLYRPFLHALPVFSILLALFVISRNSAFEDAIRRRGKMITKALAMIALAVMIIFLLLTPLTMNTDSSFMYAPTVYLMEVNYLTRYGNGTIATFQPGSEFGYYQLLNNASSIYIVDYSDLGEQYQARIIATTYMGFAKDAFFVFSPPLTQTMENLESSTSHPNLAKIYCADPWNTAYFNESNTP